VIADVAWDALPFVGVFALLVLGMALLAPLEALGWWAGWFPGDLNPLRERASLPPPLPGESDDRHFVVYLTGIGGFGGQFLARREKAFLEGLEQRLPESVIVRDVFPFSVSNNPLNGERLLSFLYRWVQRRRLRHPRTVFGLFIVLRNMLQVFVAADPRYGPINNFGVALEVARSLVQQGYTVQGRRPITLIGYSGGGMISVGIARSLHLLLNAPVRIVSVGGVFASDGGLDDVERLLHIRGNRDWVPLLADVIFAGRWRVFPTSAFNRARRQGRLVFFDPGAMTHSGPEGYFARRAKRDEDGQVHAEYITDLIAEEVKRRSDEGAAAEDAAGDESE
jgi:hypothetical protein